VKCNDYFGVIINFHDPAEIQIKEEKSKRDIRNGLTATFSDFHFFQDMQVVHPRGTFLHFFFHLV